MLQIKEISKGFRQPDGTTLQVLRDITLSLRDGDILGLIGPNGSGKTTLLNVLSGELRPDKGYIYVDRFRADRLPAHRRYRFIGRVHQESYKAMAADLTVAEMLAIAARRGHSLRLTRPSADRAVSELAVYAPHVADFLRERANIPTKQLSGGQRQLLALAVSILGRPKLLLLDEHLASLDATHVENADQLITNVVLKTRMMVIAVTHDHAWIDAFCTCGTRLVEGKNQDFPVGRI